MSLEKRSGMQPRTIDLTNEKIEEPLNAYRVESTRYGIAQFTPECPYIATFGVASCKVIAFYNPTEKKGLIAHVSVARNTDAVVERLVSDFGGIQSSDCYIVGGTNQARNIGGTHQWPTTEELSERLQKFHPGSLSIDGGVQDWGPRGVALNLGTGELKEVDGSRGWTWSKEHDTSVNKLLEDVEGGYK